MTDTIYTIGYSGFTVEEFVDALKAHGVNFVVDVRSKPFSRHHIEYDKPVIARTLQAQGIKYENFAREFGARQEDRKFYTPNGWLDYEKLMRSRRFYDGVVRMLDSDYTFALMCKEENPIDCHRAIMVARVFNEIGRDVIHLMPDGNNFTQDDLEHELMNLYFPDCVYGDLFSGYPTERDIINRAYRKRNEKIGWRYDEKEFIHDRLYPKDS
ncbi:MAG: DUF488 domain-containing protein [Synergistaceae bacterium]|nr:DUF488 domain-containing protein [Synergistaceae bacterium]